MSLCSVVGRSSITNTVKIIECNPWPGLTTESTESTEKKRLSVFSVSSVLRENSD